MALGFPIMINNLVRKKKRTINQREKKKSLLVVTIFLCDDVNIFGSDYEISIL